MRVKKNLPQVLILLLIMISTGWSQNTNEIKTGTKPIEIQLADEAAIIISGYKITLSDAIKKAIDNNPDILTGKYDVAMSDTNLEKFKTKYSPYFSASGGTSYTEYPEMMQASNHKSKETQFDIASSIAKTFSSGTTVAAGITASQYNTDWTVPGYPEKAYNPVVFVSLEQELLKNSFGYNDRKQEQILKNAVQMQKDEILYGLSLVVTGVIIDYWNIIVYKTQLDNAILLLNETRKVRRIIADNVSIGLAEQFELNYWNSLIAASEASVSQAGQNYRDAFRKFTQSVNMPGEITMQETAILQNRLPEINTEEALKKAYAKRADYLNTVRSLENAKLQLEIDSNGSLPSLTGSVSVSSYDYNDSLGETQTNTAAGKYPVYEAQIKMTYPLNDTDQKVSERNSRWKVEQAKYQVDKYSRIVKDDVTSKAEKINTYHTLYLKARESRIQAGIYHEKMLLNLRRGRFTAAAVRNSLDALINSRQQELQLLIQFNASLLDFEVSKNELFETYGIDVEKYIPKE
jgi:outer membrane protein TolC